MIRISVIIPTTGRASLAAAKDSCAGADEVIVVPDSTGDHGYTPRTKGIAQATGTHLSFLDDDDVFLPGAIDRMRDAACEVPAIFKMDHPQHGILWRDKVLEFGNVGTPMMLIPNIPGKLGRWEPYVPILKEPGGDYMFLKGCVEKMGDPVWRDEIIARIRPQDRTSICVVTPWHNHLEHLADFQLAMDYGKPEQLIVVDNGSDPPVPLPGIRLEENSGFSYACNIGLADATTEAVLFLNNDILPTSTDWLDQIRKAVEPGVLVGPIRHAPQANVPEIDFKLPWIDGWCLAGMREDLLELGGFSEELQEPAYYSDNLLCLEARALGMELRPIRPGVRHKVNGSTNPADPSVVEATVHNQQMFRNRARQLLTHEPAGV